jgi:alpha-beta hydrolase superfamily lysophospholipase
MKGVIASIRNVVPNGDILQIPYRGGLRNTDPNLIADRIVDEINNAVQNRGASPYKEIILVGYSFGALLARKAYLIASGAASDVSTIGRRAALPWHGQVSRIVLLAGFCRGWSGCIERPENCSIFWYTILLALLLIARVFHFGKLIRSALAGTPFVANLRADWLSLEKPPTTVQLLGDRDDVVSERDHIDLEAGRHFVYIRLPSGTNHLGTVNFRGEEGERRRKVFERAIAKPIEDLPSEYEFMEGKSPRSDVKHVVFVMHGIRDFGRWQRPLAEAIQNECGTAVETVIADYGYMPMLPFLILSERQKNVRWFMDRYIEVKALYPRARISYFGHSNGTYLLASALERYSSCRVDRVVFAGSVVKTKYDWDGLVNAGRVGAIRNYVATGDVVVGIFPAIFERWGGDLGAGGFLGFTSAEAKRFQVEFIDGGHSAALNRENFGAISSFINGKTDNLCKQLQREKQNGFCLLACKFCEFWWLVLIAVIVVVGLGIIFPFNSIPDRIIVAGCYVVLLIFAAYRL